MRQSFRRDRVRRWGNKARAETVADVVTQIVAFRIRARTPRAAFPSFRTDTSLRMQHLAPAFLPKFGLLFCSLLVSIIKKVFELGISSRDRDFSVRGAATPKGDGRCAPDRSLQLETRRLVLI